jgi:pSer/pThr/pTyr-binding forkhead associated (FHA) protein
MIKCPFCHASQVDNAIYCSECGQFLLPDDKRKTERYENDEITQVSDPLERTKPHLSLHIDAQLVAVRLRIGSNGRELEFPLNKTILLGRVDPALDVFPEVDLTQDGPSAKSVSRRHATITRQEGRVVVEDLGSVNGTYINGKRLDPYLPELLSDGDILQLGKLLIEVEIRRV